MVDAHLPRFSQAVVAAALALAFLYDVAAAVPVTAAVLLLSVAGGRRLNVFAYLYRALPIPRGELEPAAPPRFAQALGALFLGVASAGLWLAERDTIAWWALGWGPALLVATLAALAATTSF